MSENQEIYTETTVVDGHQYAGFWMRFWAYLTDLVIVFSINGILLSPFKFVNGGNPVDIGLWALTGIIGAVVLYMYVLLMSEFLGIRLCEIVCGLCVCR